MKEALLRSYVDFLIANQKIAACGTAVKLF